MPLEMAHVGAIAMPEQTQVEELEVPQLAEHCRQEAARSRRGLPHDPRYCFELFRRAIAEGNQAAWEAIHTQYRDLIRYWTGDSPNAEDLIQETLTRFFASITPERLAEFPTLGALLQFLKVIAKNLVIAQRRRKEWEERGLEAWIAEMERQGPPDPDTRLDRESLIVYIRSQLQDPDEALIFMLTFEFGLSPQEIVARYPQRFPTAQEVYRIKERFLRRLGRDPKLRHLARMRNPSPHVGKGPPAAFY
jgi:DNA-directed RNA polymerase specialized sigma24 family protein